MRLILDLNLRAVGWLLGCVLLLLSAFLLVPAGVGALYEEPESVRGCLYAALIAASVGLLATLFLRGAAPSMGGKTDYFRREGLAVVGFSRLGSQPPWPTHFLFCIPFRISHTTLDGAR